MTVTTLRPTVTNTTRSKGKKFAQSVLILGLLMGSSLVSKPVLALAQKQAAAHPSDQTLAQTTSEQKPGAEATAEKPAQPTAEGSSAEHHPTSIAGELAKETREAEGEEEEENSNLKHSSMVQKLAKVTGLSVHGAHMLALCLNFAIIAFVIIWFVAKGAPGLFRRRSESIQKALQEARAASHEASARLADIENRLRQMDAEIGRMQASAEQEAEGEESRIQKAAEGELRKVVQAAEQEIAAAAKQVRRELSAHTADLALLLARKQINVDSNTDQVLVRNFASKLAREPQGNSGKDGR